MRQRDNYLLGLWRFLAVRGHNPWTMVIAGKAGARRGHPGVERWLPRHGARVPVAGVFSAFVGPQEVVGDWMYGSRPSVMHRSWSRR